MANKRYRQNGLSPPDATDKIRALACDDLANLYQAEHFIERLCERDLIMADARHVLKHGFVYDQPEEATQPNLWKYKIEGKSPNSGNRQIGVVVIPDFQGRSYKLVTIYWVDER